MNAQPSPFTARQTREGTTPVERPRSLYLPAYTYADAGRFAETSPTNVRRWFRDLGKRNAVLSPSPEAGLSYIQLIEVRFVAAMRRKGFRLDRLRRARAYVRKQQGEDYPFATVRFKADGIDLFLDALWDFEDSSDQDMLIAVSQDGQLAMRPLLERVLSELDYEDDIAVRWYPRGKDRLIVIDPAVSFGRPTITGTGIPTTVLYDRTHAGDSVDFLAADFDLSPDQVRKALEFEAELRAA